MFHYKLIPTQSPHSEEPGHKCVGSCTSPMADPQATNQSFSIPQDHYLLPKLNTSNKQIPASGHRTELKPKIKNKITTQSLLRWWLVTNTPGKLFPHLQFLEQPQSSVLAQAGSSQSSPIIILTLPTPSLGKWDVSSSKRRKQMYVVKWAERK